MDKYDTLNDHYCYGKTSILKNKLDIMDMSTLEKAERELTEFASKQIIHKSAPYNLSTLQQLHKELFSELYEWAGELRNVNIAKATTPFCFFNYIEAESKKIFNSLKKITG